MISLLIATGALAQSVGAEAELLADTLRAELQTNVTELRLGESPQIYLLRYKLLQLHTTRIEAQFGGRATSYSSPSNALGVEVRIAEPHWDNTGMAGWQNGFGSVGLPDQLTPRALQLGAWRLTDGSYKEAVEQFARKNSKSKPPPDHPGDYLLSEPVVFHADPPPAEDDADLDSLATHLSGRMAHQGFQRGEIHVGHQHGARWILDSDGTDVRLPETETTVRAVAHKRTSDGMLIADSVLWSVPSPRALPPIERMEEEVEALVARVNETADAQLFSDEYVGPVLLTQGAAADFFRYLLLPQLKGTPTEISFDTWFGEMSGEGQAVRVGRRVLPVGWSVTADPQQHAGHVSSYTHDDEGTPAQRVELVQDGIVRDLLMSRVPRKDKTESNGHGRSSLDERAEGQPAQVSITGPRQNSPSAVHRKALKMANSYGRDWYLRVERLQVPATLDDMSAGVFLFGGADAPTLPHPVRVIRVRANGDEEILRGAAFSGIQRYLLRDIAAVGRTVEHTWMNPLDSFGSTPTSGLPSWLQAHEVLVGEMEVIPTPADPNDAHVLAAPP